MMERHRIPRHMVVAACVTTVILSLLLFTYVFADDAFTTIQRGDSGDNVREIQELLIEQGFLTSSADGKYGPMTEQAVIDFQSNNGIEASGVVDKPTYDVLTRKISSTNIEAEDDAETDADTVEGQIRGLKTKYYKCSATINNKTKAYSEPNSSSEVVTLLNKDDTIYIAQLRDGWAKFYSDDGAAYVDEQQLTKEVRDIAELDDDEHIVEVLSIVYPQHEIRSEDVDINNDRYARDWSYTVKLDTLEFTASWVDGYYGYQCDCLLESTEENRLRFLDECYYPLSAIYQIIPDEDRKDIIDKLKAGEKIVYKDVEIPGWFWTSHTKTYHFSIGILDDRYYFYMSNDYFTRVGS